MDYRKTAQEILSAIGGKGNLSSAAHCATRLRLVIADNAKVKKSVLENIDGVKGVFEAAGQLQIIIGTGTVNKVYDEFIDLAGVEAASKGQTLITFDKQLIASKGYKTITPVIVTNSFEFSAVNRKATGEVTPKNVLLELVKE